MCPSRRRSYIANTKFKGFEAMNALPHVSSSSVDDNKVKKLLGGLIGADAMGEPPCAVLLMFRFHEH